MATSEKAEVRRGSLSVVGLAFRADDVVMLDLALFFTGRAIPFLTIFFLEFEGACGEDVLLAGADEVD